MRLRELRAITDGLTEILFRFRQPIQRNQRKGDIEVRPWGGLRLQPVQFDGSIEIRDRVVESTKVVVTKSQRVICARHFRIQFDDSFQTAHGGTVAASIEIQARQPVQIERVLRPFRYELFQFWARPYTFVEFDVGHREGESAPVVQRSYCFRFFPGDGGIQVLAVEKENSGCSDEQFRRPDGFWIVLGFLD